jgi:hypothetical protein
VGTGGTRPRGGRKTFPFGREWNKKTYANKEVRPIFVEEADEIVVRDGLYLLLLTEGIP